MIVDEAPIETIEPLPDTFYQTLGLLDSGVADIPQLNPWITDKRWSVYPESSIDPDPKYATKSGNEYTDSGMRNKRDVWTVTTKSYKGAHYATFNPELIKPCILAGCPPDGTVLDPFVGSGTTCVVAGKHGRNCIGLDLNFDYLNVEARKRLSYGSYVQVDDGINQLRFKEL